MYSNEQDYVDTKYYENILEEGKEEDISLPGLISSYNGNVINNVIDIKKYYKTDFLGLYLSIFPIKYLLLHQQCLFFF